MPPPPERETPRSKPRNTWFESTDPPSTSTGPLEKIPPPPVSVALVRRVDRGGLGSSVGRGREREHDEHHQRRYGQTHPHRPSLSADLGRRAPTNPPASWPSPPRPRTSPPGTRRSSARASSPS